MKILLIEIAPGYVTATDTHTISETHTIVSFYSQTSYFYLKKSIRFRQFNLNLIRSIYNVG